MKLQLLEFVVLDGIWDRGKDIFTVRREYWIWVQVRTTEVNRSKNESKIR